MDDFELPKMLYGFTKEVCHYSQMQVFATSYYQRNYFQKQIDEAVKELINYLKPMSTEAMNISTEPLRTFTVEELAEYNGSGGKEAYVGVNGKVYDVTSKIRWAGGTHFGLYAGQDLSDQFMSCHLGMIEILEQLPVVGVLE